MNWIWMPEFHLCDNVTEKESEIGYDAEKRKEQSKMTTMNSELFRKIAMEGETPVLVEFWAPWCAYCRRIAPALDKVSQQRRGSLMVGQVDIDQEPLLALQEEIEVIPTLVLYRGGEALGSIVAPESRFSIEEFLQETLGM